MMGFFDSFIICWLLIWCYTKCPEAQSAPATIEENGGDPRQSFNEPVWSHGESYSVAYATGPGSVLQTDSWTEVDNHGGVQYSTVMADGVEIGQEVAGMTNCSQASYANATGGYSANALAYGWCNSTVLLDQPVSNQNVGKEQIQT